MIKLFVGGFPLDMEEIELAKLIAIHGDISTLKIVRDKKTRICKGYAFVEMVDMAAAEAAVEALNGSVLQGKVLSVSIREEKAISTPSAQTASFQARTPSYERVQKFGADQKKKRPRR